MPSSPESYQDIVIYVLEKLRPYLSEEEYDKIKKDMGEYIRKREERHLRSFIAVKVIDHLKDAEGVFEKKDRR
jgi:hypothetical protein